MARANLKQDILLAANRVLAREGLGKTTVEAVAQEAGVSKGGLFYYFQNKREILVGMLELYEREFLRERETVIAALPPSPRRILLATVTLMIKNMRETSRDTPNIATLLDDPDLREWVGRFKRRIFEEAGRDLEDKVGLALIVYIMDGLWMDMRFETRPFDIKYKDAAVERLLEMLDNLK